MSAAPGGVKLHGNATQLIRSNIAISADIFGPMLTHAHVFSTCRLMSAAPGGVKLHGDVTQLIGSCVRFAFATAADTYTACWHLLLPLLCLGLAAFSCIFGLCTGFAMLSDLLAVMAWPVTVLYTCIARLYSLQLHYLGVTWRLMRGSAEGRRKRRAPAPAAAAPDGGPASPGGMAALWGNQQTGKVRAEPGSGSVCFGAVGWFVMLSEMQTGCGFDMRVPSGSKPRWFCSHVTFPKLLTAYLLQSSALCLLYKQRRARPQQEVARSA